MEHDDQGQGKTVVTMQGGESLYNTELIIILGVIIFQLIHTFRVYRQTRGLRAIFDKLLLVRNGYVSREYLGNPDQITGNIIYPAAGEEPPSGSGLVRITLTETEGKSEIIQRIKMAVNTYLLNNYGAAVNFSIIRDLVEREVETRDEEISQSVPVPLYLGLAATMVGIIFGLLAMPEVDGNNFSGGINSLIDGVKLAMTASLSGLLCTTVLSSFFYKRARAETLRRKNAQLSYLQAKLLPELIRAEDTGVSGLKASLDHFAREATGIVTGVQEAVTQTGRTITWQNEIIGRLERLDMTKVSKVNLELFDRLENNMEALRHFSQYLGSLEAIATHLGQFAERTRQVDALAGKIDSTLEESRELTRFLTSHFEKMEKAGSAALRAVDLTESHFGESIGALRDRTQKSIESLYSLSDQTDATLRDSFGKVTDQLREVTSRHLDEFMAAYSKAVPQFGQLKNLESLGALRDIIDTRSGEMVRRFDASNRAVAESIQELTRLLTGREPVKLPRRRWWETAETLLRILAWLGILAVTTGIILRYFGIL